MEVRHAVDMQPRGRVMQMSWLDVWVRALCEMRTQRHLRKNLVFAAAGVPSLGRLKHPPFNQGIFAFSHIYTLVS